jgi:hypothetical protein
VPPRRRHRPHAGCDRGAAADPRRRLPAHRHLQGARRHRRDGAQGARPPGEDTGYSRPQLRADLPGVHISFYTLVHDTQCRPDTPFGSARITRAWVTDRGLRQGDTVAKARRLYPRAERPHFAGPNAIGLIVKLSQAVGDYGLAAVVNRGRVTALAISDPQGGE